MEMRDLKDKYIYIRDDRADHFFDSQITNTSGQYRIEFFLPFFLEPRRLVIVDKYQKQYPLAIALTDYTALKHSMPFVENHLYFLQFITVLSSDFNGIVLPDTNKLDHFFCIFNEEQDLIRFFCNYKELFDNTPLIFKQIIYPHLIMSASQFWLATCASKKNCLFCVIVPQTFPKSISQIKNNYFVNYKIFKSVFLTLITKLSETNKTQKK